jgi:predicted dehydrogenase
MHTIGIVIDGATGRLGTTQHLRALLAMRNEGGLGLANGDRLLPEPLLLGRDSEKLAALSARSGGLRWSTDRDSCLADPAIQIYFDASATGERPERAHAALAAGKHIYLEKPIATSLDEALSLARATERAGKKGGVVQDKLFLPGLKKLRKLYETQFFGRILSIRLDFGWWVFDGELFSAQRPSWNYRKATGGGLILDMFAHWRYIFDRLLGPITSVSCRHLTAQPQRRDEAGRRYAVDVEDHAFAIFELEGGILAQIASSWASRVQRDDLLQRSPACIAALCNRWQRRQSHSSAQNSRNRWCSTNSGRKCQTWSRSKTATAPDGNCFCATSPKMRRLRRRSSTVRKACSWLRHATRATASAAGWT